MARFPTREAEIMALAQNIIAGLSAGGADFPAPPVAVAALQADADAAQSADDAAIAAHSAAKAATTVKKAAYRKLIRSMRADLRYAEDAVAFNDDKLKGLGWAGHTVRTPLGLPGQPTGLETPTQGKDWLTLEWEAAAEGGAVNSYRVERREHPTGAWAIVGVAIETETTLTHQERGKEWEYRVVALNKTGESLPSNTVFAVL